MGEPTTPEKYPKADPLLMAVNEIGSAASCLHMEDAPIFGPFQDACGPEGYIVNNQFWAKHAYEHLRAAQEWLRKIP